MDMAPKQYTGSIPFFHIFPVLSSFLQLSPPWFKFSHIQKTLLSLSHLSCPTPTLHSQESLKSLPHWLHFFASHLAPGPCSLVSAPPLPLSAQKSLFLLLRASPTALGTAEHALLITLFPLFWLLLRTLLLPWFPTRGDFALQWTRYSIWRHFQLSQWKSRCYCHLVCRG